MSFKEGMTPYDLWKDTHDDSYHDEVSIPMLSGYERTEEDAYCSVQKVTRLFSGWNLVQVCLLAAVASIPLHVYFRVCSPLLGFLTYSVVALPFSILVYLTSSPKGYTISLSKPEPSSPPSYSSASWPWSRSPSTSLSIPALVYLLGCAWSLCVWAFLLGTALFRGLHLSADVFSSAPPTIAEVGATSPGHSVFFAVNLYNSAEVLPAFSKSLKELCSSLGHRNVFVSIYESNSSDDTCERLQILGEELKALGIPQSVRCGKHSVRHGKVAGVISSYSRIEYLASVRNEALAPLDDLGSLDSNVGPFSHVAWLNDIFFDPVDVITLLNTKGGEFDQVCAIDTVPMGFYDTWVTRDINEARLKPLWPYFSSAEDIASMRVEEPILVNSCWNGLTIFDASWFTSHSRRPLLLQESAKAEVQAKHNLSLPLRFRASPAPHCLTSECLLTSYDQHLLSAPHRPRIYINPQVLVSYDASTLALYHVWSRWWISRAWLFVWQDVISTRLFGRVTDWGRKLPKCAQELHAGWAKLDAPLRPLAPLVVDGVNGTQVST
ncbi:hypothetical protein BCV69DRAFT_281152 [Microstroma glucosiphilum]|uniref:Glycosyltransferase family 69 protein n=1 Tax=Pseudomicrostroma glucosiphilum TaxID=1684307 RepID=A0A316UA73_9BASI|nr:hypothetical protein BCV69DRAFT_281152 [Pseudomicrostroma glucosiphilum]PWN22147.1 hypothetical protein BCV69DRAFT_281152 [Pseudomicrostroma glucosiphilum]